jgi:hypothetical protein
LANNFASTPIVASNRNGGQGGSMTREKVAFMQCRKFRFRPIARRIELKGRELPCIDDWWRITSLSRQTFKLVNARTNQVVTLGLHHITGFIPEGSANGALVLQSQVILKGSSVLVAPLGY